MSDDPAPTLKQRMAAVPAPDVDGVKNWCGLERCFGHPHESERCLVDMVTGRYTCCGTDALRVDAFHAAGCPNG